MTTQHQMNLEDEYGTWTLWKCPTCGRKIAFNAAPEPGQPHIRVMVEGSNPQAEHTGGIGIEMGASVSQDDPRLKVFDEFVRGLR